MRILFLIRKYKVTDGASTALYRFIKYNKELTYSKILTRFTVSYETDMNIQSVDSWKQIADVLKHEKFDLVYYFKTGGYDIYNWTIKALKVLSINIPVITVICQRPSYPGLWLSPTEIQYSTKLVFIDKTSYNDPLYGFIPKCKKEQIYFGASKEIIEKTDELTKKKSVVSDPVIYGRGSTLSKCPSNMLDVFDAIKLDNKKFVIAGVTKDSWVGEKAAKRNNIEVVPQSSFDDWLKTCSEFDIYLYHLPKESHASIDGTLGNAMLLNCAVAYLGPDAPAERFVHGVNALVAKNEDELIEYAELLGKDTDLRKRIGKAARESTIKDFSLDATMKKYDELNKSIMSNITAGKRHIKIPLSYKLKFYKTCRNQIVKSWLGGSWLERHHFAKHPLV